MGYNAPDLTSGVHSVTNANINEFNTKFVLIDIHIVTLCIPDDKSGAAWPNDEPFLLSLFDVLKK